MLSRWIASSSRTSLPSSRSSLPSVPVLTRRSIYSSLPRRNDELKPEPSTEASTPTPSPTSTSTTTTPTTSPPPRRKAPALFTVRPDGSIRTTGARPPRSPLSTLRPRQPPMPTKVNRLRQHLLQWTDFKALPEEERSIIEKKIKKRVKAVEGISTTMAKWYSDPIPYIFPPPVEMFGVERKRTQGLSWVPTIGDRVFTPFNSYGIITAIRPAAEQKPHPKKLAKIAAREEASKPSPPDDDADVDPTWAPAPETPQVQKLDIEMPADWILMSSKNGPYAGAVEKKLAVDEATRVRSGGKARVGSIGADGKVVKEEVKVTKMVAEVRVETDSTIREFPLSHPLESLKYAPLSQSNLSALLLETGHSSIPAAQDAGYRPSPSTFASTSWTETLWPKSASSSQPLPMPLRRRPAGYGVSGREGYLRRYESFERDIRGGQELVGAPRRLLDREKAKVVMSKMADEQRRKERFESFEAPPEGSGIVVRRRPWRVHGGIKKVKEGEEGREQGGSGFGLD